MITKLKVDSKSHRQTRKITNHDSTSSDDDLEEEQMSPVHSSTSLKRTRYFYKHINNSIFLF
jgi:hypothetical protein